MCAYSVFNTFPVYPLSAKPLILLAFCRYRYHTSLLCRLVCRRPQAAKPVLRRGSSRSAFPLWGKAVMAYPPTGSVQTECTRLPVMLRTKGRFLCQRTIGFVGLQKHINSGYAFAERQIAHNGKRGKGTRSPHGLKDYPT